MANYNPMLEQLQTDISNHNKEVARIIEQVANRQFYLTVGVILFNIIVYFALDAIIGNNEPILPPFSNSTLNFLLTLSLVAISFPTAAKYAKSSLAELRLDTTKISADLDFAGSWDYETTFRIQSGYEDCDEYKLLVDNMDGYTEKGLSVWNQNIFDLKIDFANTVDKQQDIKPEIIWKSDPISYNSSEVRWSFSGKIWWINDENYANEFSGIEFYRVTEHDELGRPALLEGKLTGTILVGKKFYVVDAVSKFMRKH